MKETNSKVFWKDRYNFSKVIRILTEILVFTILVGFILAFFYIRGFKAMILLIKEIIPFSLIEIVSSIFATLLFCLLASSLVISLWMLVIVIRGVSYFILSDPLVIYKNKLVLGKDKTIFGKKDNLFSTVPVKKIKKIPGFSEIFDNPFVRVTNPSANSIYFKDIKSVYITKERELRFPQWFLSEDPKEDYYYINIVDNGKKHYKKEIINFDGFLTMNCLGFLEKNMQIKLNRYKQNS